MLRATEAAVKANSSTKSCSLQKKIVALRKWFLRHALSSKTVDWSGEIFNRIFNSEMKKAGNFFEIG